MNLDSVPQFELTKRGELLRAFVQGRTGLTVRLTSRTECGETEN